MEKGLSHASVSTLTLSVCNYSEIGCNQEKMTGLTFS